LDKNQYLIAEKHGKDNQQEEKSMEIATEYIKLDSFLKMTGAVGTGGEAKIRITEGEVLVNGAVELRRGRKLYPGDRVAIGNETFQVKGPEQ
jgi:ribosome-associated protein